MQGNTGKVLSVVGGTTVDPAKDGILLQSGQRTTLRHASGCYRCTNSAAGIEYLCIIGQRAGAIGTAGGMATRYITGGLYRGIYICGK